MTRTRWLSVPAVLLLTSGPSLAKGGNMRSADLYEPQHIENLPAEVLQEVLRWCPAPMALHSFASYTDHLQKLVLHFEHLYCGVRPFAGRPVAFIKPMFYPAATTTSCKATTPQKTKIRTAGKPTRSSLCRRSSNCIVRICQPFFRQTAEGDCGGL
jgi:hypothetical protein